MYYIGMNKFSASTSDHKPLHACIQNSTGSCLYITELWKTNQIVTLGLFHFIGLANSYIHTLSIHNAITRLE